MPSAASETKTSKKEWLLEQARRFLIRLKSPRKHPFFALAVVGTALTCIFLLVLLTGFLVLYNKYSRIVDDRIRRPIFSEPAQIYAGADRVAAGERWSMDAVLAELRGAGYVASNNSTRSDVGTFNVHGNALDINPGSASFNIGHPATFHFGSGKVRSITGPSGEALGFYDLEPQLITGLFDAKRRSKRRLLTYDEIPPLVVNAIVSVEDRRFFEHNGINYVRLVEGLITPVVRHRRMQGGSTLTMQMARAFFLTNERSVSRKVAEMVIALILEHRFTKQQILEIYVNQVNFGQHGSFDISGFGEAAQVFFGKDIKNVNLPEAALLAGVVNGPTVYSPFRHPAAAKHRRDVVLDAMYANHVISNSQLATAKDTPIKLAPPNVDAKDAPYYVDLVRERLLDRFDESDLTSGGMRVYTSLDRRLQEAAIEAINVGMKQVDATITRRRTKRIREGKGKNATIRTEVTPGPMPQVALIAIDPHTGEVLALAGGRDYVASQLNHAVARRPTGSIFKPFVYATAMNTALTGDPAKAITQTTMLDATEGTFDFEGKPYAPHNFDPQYSVGEVTARFALQHSINTATIRLADMVGYDKVVQLAKAAGIEDVKPTPAMAIGAYDATALDMAGAYTVFANDGTRMAPTFLRAITARNGDPLERITTEKTNVLDSRVAYVITDMLQAVVTGGTAASVGARFTLPAAGKTGTSHDAWFAGYTSNLLCVVWVGNDDYTDIKMEGAKAAAPIWTEFMLRASKLQRYADMKPFTPPSGVLPVHLDKISNLPADESCPDDYDAYFIDGTIPAATCDHPDGPSRNLWQKMLGLGRHSELVLPPVTQPNPQPNAGTPVVPNTPLPGQVNPANPTDQQQPAPPVKEKKKGFWKRLFGGGKNDKPDNEAPPATNPDSGNPEPPH